VPQGLWLCLHRRSHRIDFRPASEEHLMSIVHHPGRAVWIGHYDTYSSTKAQISNSHNAVASRTDNTFQVPLSFCLVPANIYRVAYSPSCACRVCVFCCPTSNQRIEDASPLWQYDNKRRQNTTNTNCSSDVTNYRRVLRCYSYANLRMTLTVSTTLTAC